MKKLVTIEALRIGTQSPSNFIQVYRQYRSQDILKIIASLHHFCSQRGFTIRIAVPKRIEQTLVLCGLRN